MASMSRAERGGVYAPPSRAEPGFGPVAGLSEDRDPRRGPVLLAVAVAVLLALVQLGPGSALAVAIAKAVDGVVVNADSMQVYEELRVLSARPSPEEEAEVARLAAIAEAERLAAEEAARAATSTTTTSTTTTTLP